MIQNFQKDTIFVNKEREKVYSIIWDALHAYRKILYVAIEVLCDIPTSRLLEQESPYPTT